VTTQMTTPTLNGRLPALFSLQERSAVITGASRGIGAALAEGFAAAGAHVVLIARTRSDLNEVADRIRAAGGHVDTVACDLADRDASLKACQEAESLTNGVDVLVNNAGGPVFQARFLDIREDGWEKVFRLNVTSAVRVTQELGRGMVSRGRGAVVNISSIGAMQEWPEIIAYCAAKAALNSLTRSRSTPRHLRGGAPRRLGPAAGHPRHGAVARLRRLPVRHRRGHPDRWRRQRRSARPTPRGAGPVMTDLLIIGAGPAGMAAALYAVGAGLHPLVLEAEPEGRDRRGSRAIFIHRRTLDLLDKAWPGLGRTIAGDGLVWPQKRTFWFGRLVHQRTYTPLPVRQAPFASLPQPVIEQRLMHACASTALPIAWNSRVVDVATGRDHVTVHTSDGATHTAPYLIAADGAGSTVRKALGIPLDSGVSDRAFVIADVADDPDHPLPCSRDFHYRHPAVGHRNVLLVPFQGGWRADLQCHPSDDAQALTADAATWVQAVLGHNYGNRLTWASAYYFRQRVARNFHDPHHRVLLVSEAAHQYPPFGARGMNSGIADAHAAVTAIIQADTAPGHERHPPVQGYTRSRRAAALTNQAAAASALHHLEAPRVRDRAAQQLAATAATAFPRWQRPGRWLDTRPYGPTLKHSSSGSY
jgi:3-(3-hydroxy-phenyl)propionate hydroxylase